MHFHLAQERDNIIHIRNHCFFINTYLSYGKWFVDDIQLIFLSIFGVSMCRKISNWNMMSSYWVLFYLHTRLLDWCKTRTIGTHEILLLFFNIQLDYYPLLQFVIDTGLNAMSNINTKLLILYTDWCDLSKCVLMCKIVQIDFEECTQVIIFNIIMSQMSVLNMELYHIFRWLDHACVHFSFTQILCQSHYTM